MTNNRNYNNNNSCASDFESDALSVTQAHKKIQEEIQPLQESETLPLRSCLDRFLAEDIISPINVPSHANSAMDGYAIAGKDLPTTASKNYKVVGISYAGTPSSEHYQSGQVVRIMTGGVMPEGTDTVIMQEMVEHIDNGISDISSIISIKAEHKTGQNVRHPGEDIEKGKHVLLKGHQVSPADLGILSSLGLSECSVFRRPKIAFFSTGDELVSVGKPLREGEIYDSNRYTLCGMLKQLDVEVIDLGVVKDTPDAIKDAFIKASQQADIVITSGGVSVGEADYIKPILKELGKTYFWKIRVKPGRPLTFGRINGACFFGLPGNPVAVMITFLQFVQPAIRYLSSGKIKPTITFKAESESEIYKRPGRTEYQRAIFKQRDDGSFTVKRTGKQGSGILTSMSIANCFIVLSEDSGGIKVGDTVDIQPFPSNFG